MINLAVFLKQNGYKPDQVQDFIPAPLDVATCMYYTGLDPFTKKPVFIAKGLRDRKTQRALMQFFKSENYFEVREALRQAGRTDLIGDGCDALIPATPPKEALLRRREDANARSEVNTFILSPTKRAIRDQAQRVPRSSVEIEPPKAIDRSQRRTTVNFIVGRSLQSRPHSRPSFSVGRSLQSRPHSRPSFSVGRSLQSRPHSFPNFIVGRSLQSRPHSFPNFIVGRSLQSRPHSFPNFIVDGLSRAVLNLLSNHVQQAHAAVFVRRP